MIIDLLLGAVHKEGPSWDHTLQQGQGGDGEFPLPLKTPDDISFLAAPLYDWASKGFLL
jgi:hypothetical protein